MRVKQTELSGVFVIEPAVHNDECRQVLETFREDELVKCGIDAVYVQGNQIFLPQKGTLSGIHFQNFPYAQSRLVRCLQGEALNIAVDLRSWSPNYKKWVGIVLSKQNNKQLYIPHGFGHGYLSLCDNTEVAINNNEYSYGQAKRSISWRDDSININWGESAPVLSKSDENAPLLKDSDCNLGTKILVTGVKGQLGFDVCKLLKKKGIEHIGVDILDFDLTDLEAVSKYVKKYKPTGIIHCAAYTAVDKAEDDVDLCLAVNVVGTKNLAMAAKEIDAKFLYISTDYVYGGDGAEPYKEDDKTTPLNVYGKTKLLGEDETKKATDKHFIVRTSWIFGKNGNNFVKTMLKLGMEKGELNIIADQIGSPTYTPDLSKLIVDMIFTDNFGTYNASNEGYCSWKDFADEIFNIAGIAIKTSGVASSEYPVKAIRPKNSRLDKLKLEQNGFKRLPTWQDALKRFMQEI